jgi:hypothetical protein
MTGFRRLARDYERLPEMLAGLHLLAFVMILIRRFVDLLEFLSNSALQPLAHTVCYPCRSSLLRPPLINTFITRTLS